MSTDLANFTNNAYGTFLSGVLSGAGSFTLQTGEGDLFPADYPYNLTLEKYSGDNVIKRELITVTNKGSDTFTITRSAELCRQAYNDTTPASTAQSFDAGDTVRLDITAQWANSVIQEWDVINDLVSTDTDKPLSANQGKALQDWKTNVSDIVDTLVSTSTILPLSANQGKELEDTKATIVTVATKVTWPASAVDERIAVFDWTTGKLVKDSWFTRDDVWYWDNIITWTDYTAKEANTERSKSNDQTFTKVKEIEVWVSGTYTVSVEIHEGWGGVSTFDNWCRIYKNWVYIWTDFPWTISWVYVAKTQNLTFVATDLVQIYYRTQNVGEETIFVQNFNLKYSLYPQYPAAVTTATTVNLD